MVGMPSASEAKQAVTAALDAWVRGEPNAPLRESQPKIEFIDAHFRDGQKLQSYEFVGEVPDQGVRRFEVVLHFADGSKPETTQYVVVGIDPLWVYRKQDFDYLMRWDHAMPAEPPTAADNERAAPSGASSDESGE